jgi:dTMP kinase
VTGRGRLLAFEGIDGCGKSTQARRVADQRHAVCTFEPGDTALGASLRAIVLDGAVSATPLAEALVMSADRAQHVAEVLAPALEAGTDVVCDRFSGSTLAYQGFGRGVGLDDLRAVLTVATGGLEPDVTVLLDCPVGVARARLAGRGRGGDRFEGADGGFLDRVRDGFLELARGDARWRVVDADQPVDAVASAVDAAVREVLG